MIYILEEMILEIVKEINYNILRDYN